MVILRSCSSQASQNAVTDAHEPDMTRVILDSAQKKNAGVEVGGSTVQNLHAVIKASGIVDVPPQNLITGVAGDRQSICRVRRRLAVASSFVELS